MGNKRAEQRPVGGRHLANTVFLRAEAITEAEMKAVNLAQTIGEFFAVAILIVEVCLKFLMTDKTYLLSKASQWWNLATAVSCLLGLLSCLSIFITRCVRYRHKYWGRRRKIIVYMAMAECLVLVLSLVFMAAQNLYVLIIDCTWFSTFVRACTFVQWTSWNTMFLIMHIEARGTTFWKRKGKVVRKHGKDRIMMDAPFHVHWWVVLNWLAFEAVAIALLVTGTSGYERRFRQVALRCDRFTYDCKQRAASVSFLVIIFLAWLLWIAMWMLCVYRALKDLHERPWHRFKMPNIVIRVQIRSRVSYVVIFAISVILLGFVKINSCASFSQTWLGLTPVSFVFATMSISSLYFYMPKSPQLIKPMVQRMLQQFAWTDDQKLPRLATRNRRLTGLKQEVMCRQPLFCFETAIKSFYFSALIYQYQEETAAAVGKREPSEATVQGYTIEKAMELYNLERFELLVEPAEDTKVLVCWNTDTVVLAFRGTASMTNVLADLQVWMSVHPPRRGRVWSRPKVHAGFLKAWKANKLHRRVLSRIKSIFETNGVALDKMAVIVTGHSLGGALATLAAYDIAREFRDQLGPDQVSCYTFGAPRTGNHAFAKDYSSVVPDTWHLINTRDIVPRSGKFFYSYKRPGQRVVINQMGDMLVRPSYVEISASQNSLPFQSRVTDHYLASYQASLVSICSAQFGQKAFGDGVQGGIDEKRAERMAGWGGLTLFQITGQLQKGVNMIGTGAMETLGAKTVPKSEDKSTSLRCHNGVCWREGGETMAEDDEDGDGPPRDPAEQRRTKLVTLSKRRLAVPSWRASRASSENNTNGCITEEEEEEMMEGSADDEDTVVTGHLSTSDSDSEAGDGFEGDPEAGRAGPGSTGMTSGGAGLLNSASVPGHDRNPVKQNGQAAVVRSRGGSAVSTSSGGGEQQHEGSSAEGGDGIVALEKGIRTDQAGAEPVRSRSKSSWWMPRFGFMHPAGRKKRHDKQAGLTKAATAKQHELGSDVDLLYLGGTADADVSLHKNRVQDAEEPAEANALTPQQSLHDLAATHSGQGLKSSRNDREQQALEAETARIELESERYKRGQLGSIEERRARLVGQSRRSLGSDSMESWKSGTLEEQLQEYEEDGLLPEVLMAAKAVKKEKEECSQRGRRRGLLRLGSRQDSTKPCTQEEDPEGKEQ